MSAGQPPIDSSEIRRLTPVLGPGYTFGSVTDKISSIVLTRPTSFGWYMGFLIAFGLTGLMTVAIGCLCTKGTGIWGDRKSTRLKSHHGSRSYTRFCFL